MRNFYIYLLVINSLSFLLFAADKYMAIHHKWRISEKNLMLCAILGGSVGAYISMQLFRHKTKHKKFTIGIPVIFIAQLFAYIYAFPFLFKQ